MPAPRSERIEATRLKLEQVRNQLRQLEARAVQEERKRDTRRKIILGGLLLDAAAKEPQHAALMRELIARIARPQDKAAFADWTLAQPSNRATDRT